MNPQTKEGLRKYFVQNYHLNVGTLALAIMEGNKKKQEEAHDRLYQEYCTIIAVLGVSTAEEINQAERIEMIRRGLIEN